MNAGLCATAIAGSTIRRRWSSRPVWTAVAIISLSVFASLTDAARRSARWAIGPPQPTHEHPESRAQCAQLADRGPDRKRNPSGAKAVTNRPTERIDGAVDGWLRRPGDALAQGLVLDDRRAKLLARWLTSDAEAATEWLVETAVGADDSLVREALGFAADTDPVLGIDVAATLDERNRDHVVSLALRLWVRRDPVAATEWFETAATREVKDRFLARLAEWYASDAPDDASRWVSTLPVRDARLAVRGIFRSAAARDLQGALGMVARVADADVRAEAAGSVLSSWVRVAPSRAEEWLRSYPDEAHRASLYMTLFMMWTLEDLAAAADRLDHIPDERDRNAATFAVLRMAIEADALLAERLYARLPVEFQSDELTFALHAALEGTALERASRDARGGESTNGDVAR